MDSKEMRQPLFTTKSVGWAATVITALLAALLYMFTPLFSDDIGYLVYMNDTDGFGHGVWGHKVIRAMGFHYIHVNGRNANFLAMLLMGIRPQWLLALLMGAGAGLSLWGMLKLSDIWERKHAVTAVCVMTGVYFFCFPWWDVTIIDCCLNYVWAAALILIFFVLLKAGTRLKGFPLLLAALVSFVAGGMHVGATTPAAAAIFVWYRFIGRHPEATRSQKILFWCFAAAALICFLSPGNWFRAAKLEAPDDTPLLLLLKSEPLTLLMTLLFGVLLCLRSTRSRMVRLLGGESGIWVLTAYMSTAFVLVGGKVGRAGWFADTFSVIAMALCCREYGLRISRRSGALLSALIMTAEVASGVMTGIWSERAARPDRELRREMAASNDTIFYKDLTARRDMPRLAMGRVRVMKPYDEFSRSQLAVYYKKNGMLKILPEEARGVDFSLQPVTRFSDGSYVTSRLPADAEPPCKKWFATDTWTFTSGGKRYYAVEFAQTGRRYWIVREWDPDYGDR